MKPGRAALLLTVLALCLRLSAQNKKDDPSQIGNRDVGKGINFYSLEREIALGKQLAEEVQRQAKIIDDPLISEYVNRLGQNLVRNSDAKVPFTFQVIDSEVPNAFALPGGYVFVNTGLIELAEEEDELAGAMAHEIAHVAARHLTRQATKSQLARLGVISAGVLLGGWAGLAVGQGANIAMPMAFLGFSRADESEADYLGVQYLYAAGYDPTSIVTIFERLDALSRRQPGATSRLLSTHPRDSDRIQKTQKEIQQILPPRDEYLVNTSDYVAMRQRVFAREAQKKPPDEKTRPTLMEH
jgi:beta-barrel assembly-enhancing protease